MGTRSLQGAGREGKDYDFIADCGEDALYLKYCWSCNEDLPLCKFGGDSCKYDGMRGICRDCKSEYDKKYRLKNKNKTSERHKKYYLKNRDKRLAQMKECRLKNKH